MEILNINSYYLSSSLYKPMEDSLIDRNCNISTYVPVSTNYKVRNEIKFNIPEYVNISICFSKKDRLVFHYKHYKIKKDFFKKYKINKYDILHAHSLFSNGYIAYKANQKYKVPYIVVVRSTDINVFFNKMPHLRRLGRKILINASKIIFLSKSYEQECINKYIPQAYKSIIKNKSEVIPNGIDDYWFKNKIDIPKEHTKGLLKIIFVGNDSNRKNLKTLIESCQILTDKKYKIELTVVGKVIEKHILNKLKKINSVKLLGEVSRSELLNIYRESEIFVLPSVTETFGLVYAEAMSQGLPVIYTKGQGFDGQFKEGMVGYSVNCYNPNDISKKILKISQNYNEISRKCINLVNKFSWQKISHAYNMIYISTMKPNE